MNYSEFEALVAAKDVCIWGYGNIGKSYALIALRCAGANVIGYCDSNYRENVSFEGIPLMPKDTLFRWKNVLVAISLKNTDAQEEIQKELIEHDIECFVLDNCLLTGLCSSIEQSLDCEVNEKYNDLIDDSLYLKSIFKMRTGRTLSLENPKSFNEKIQWLKLYDRNPVYTKLVDKFTVKEIVSNIIGNEYIIPTLGVYDNFDEICFDILPSQFVIKCTHDSGSVAICRDKSCFDLEKVQKKIKRALSSNMYWKGREWPYKNVKPRILVEKYMGDNLNDYKVFVINGKAKHIQVDYNRFVDHHRNFYDRDWNWEDFTTLYPRNPDYKIERPENLELLIELSERVAKWLEIPAFVRVDFYIIEKQLYFGEITFYHGDGFEPFSPIEWDYKLGECINVIK